MVAFKNLSKKTLVTKNGEYVYYSLPIAAEKLGINLSKLPNTLKILFENLLRYEDDKIVKKEDIIAIAEWLKNKKSNHEIAYNPARVLMQDFTGVPAIVDLAAMRDAVEKLGGNSEKINPLSPVDLVIDHSVQVDSYGSQKSFEENVEFEFERNSERYKFLKWGQQAFNNFRVVPPGTGICHQVNLEYLAKVVWTKQEGQTKYAFPDTLVGTDSHTTMINGIAVLGWGVGGIEAEAAMLGQPISMLIPEVIGFKLIGKLKEGVTATDLVLTVTQILRKKGVVEKFVEFYGDGLDYLTLADRATIANMAPEYGATCGFFPIDQETLDYMHLTARAKEEIELVEKYTKLQGLWRNKGDEPEFTEVIELNLSDVEPCLAGPRRPQDKIILKEVTAAFKKELPNLSQGDVDINNKYQIENTNFSIGHGDVVIAAITSCTNTSNPYVMIAAGLIAKKAVELGIKPKPWVKTSLAPGSKVVSGYFERTKLQEYLDKIGFNLVGYGCTTCIGNSGPLYKEIEDCISNNNLVVTSVLSGNRNFEGRIHPLVRGNYLASPPLVVIYAIAGSINIDITKDPISKDKNGKDIYLVDLWPTNREIAEYVKKYVDRETFKIKYSDLFEGDKFWKAISTYKSKTYNWDKASTYINNPPYFENMKIELDGIRDIKNAGIIALLGDSITTDHISPAGTISKNSPAAKYLENHGVKVEDFNSYGSRRGNHEVMMRGTFANIRIRNELAPGTEGGYTKYYPGGKEMTIYDAAVEYKKINRPLIVIAGKEYGTGSSRDWAAKGTKLLGIKAVIAESFERIHRSNLVGMGVIPLTFMNGLTRKELNIKGDETFDIIGLESNFVPHGTVKLFIHSAIGVEEIALTLAIDTQNEIEYIKNGGILNFVIRNLIKQ